MIEDLRAEGGDARNLARLASRLARANAAIEILADGAARYLALRDQVIGAPKATGAGPQNANFEAAAFAGLPEEIRLRLLLRAIDRVGHEGPAELGKAEALLTALDRALQKKAKTKSAPTADARQPKLKQTLAGAIVSLSGGRIVISAAPPRRRRPD